MGLQYQFQLEDARRKKEQAQKAKGRSTTSIVIGSIVLLLAILSFAFTVMVSIAKTEGYETVVGCCGGIAIILGIVGIVILPMGVIGRINSSNELEAAETEIREIRIQMIAQEEKKTS